jgi:hypothetical protein
MLWGTFIGQRVQLDAFKPGSLQLPATALTGYNCHESRRGASLVEASIESTYVSIRKHNGASGFRFGNVRKDAVDIRSTGGLGQQFAI